MNGYLHIPALLALVLVCAIFTSGCTSNAGYGAGTAAHSITPSAVESPEPAHPLTEQVSTTVPTIAPEESFLIYTNPTYHLNMSYPADWQKVEVDPSVCWGLRDYGKTTCNIVNFFSPSTSDGTYHTFSIDVDNSSAIDQETYFNQICGALENDYTGLTVVKSSFQGTISNNTAYALYFRKGNEGLKTPLAIEVVTFAQDKIPYIVSYNSGEDPQFDTMLESIQITEGNITLNQI